MSDLIELDAGRHPWSPTPETQTVVQLDEHNVPLAGIISQQGVDYLYVCAAGEENPSSVWLYAIVTPAEVAALSDVDGLPLVQVMTTALRHKTVRAALVDDWKLVMWDHFDNGEDKPGLMVRRFLKRLEARMARYGRNINTLERDASIDFDEELALH